MYSTASLALVYYSRPNGSTSEMRSTPRFSLRTDFVNVHREGKRFFVRADEMLTAFMEPERKSDGNWAAFRSTLTHVVLNTASQDV